MLRVALAPLLFCAASCFRQQSPGLAKKVYGPTHRGCRSIDKKFHQTDSVIGGTIVEDPAEFPFIAWLGDNDGTGLSLFCGGSLITDRIVLTAGHCLYNHDAYDAALLVRLKLTNFANMSGVARDVVNWKRHPGYSDLELSNDLAMLLLNESVPASVVRPLPVSDGSKSFEHSGDKMVVGWGSMDEACIRYDTLLRKTEVPFGTDGPKCSSPGSKTLTTEDDYDWKRQCCAGDYAGEMHYPGCGDSGGPLFAKDGDWWSSVGMVSWSYGVPYPDVFTRVSYFKKWIEETSAELLAAGVHPAVHRYGPAARNAPIPFSSKDG